MARFILLALLAAPCAAWLAPLAPRRASVRVRSAVTAEAVEFARKSAEDASEQFGKKSAAAAALWDVYEELSATAAPDEALKPGIEVSAAKIAEITRAAASSRRSIGQVRSGLEAMKDVKLSDFAGSAKAGAAKVDDLQYKAAKAAAEAAVSEHGKDSAEARAAWDIVARSRRTPGRARRHTPGSTRSACSRRCSCARPSTRRSTRCKRASTSRSER